MTRVVVVSDVRLYRDGVAWLLGTSRHVDVVAVVADVKSGIQAAQDVAPDVFVVHLVSHEGPAAVRELAGSYPLAKVIVLALREEGADVISHAQAGATGYLPLDGSLDDLLSTIESVMHGEALVSPRVAGALLRQMHIAVGDGTRPKHSHLTLREVDVLDLIERGWTNKEIARHLGISLATVKNHVHALLEKLCLSRRGEAAAWAREHLADRLIQLRTTELR